MPKPHSTRSQAWWRRCRLGCLTGLTIGSVAAAQAAVLESSAAHFVSVHEQTVARDPKAIFRMLVRPNLWWSSAHTWSGNARHLSLDPRAGGCFCERWPGNQVQHGRVVRMQKYSMLRLEAALGPLQDMAVNGTLTWTLEPLAEGTVIKVQYRVHGVPTQKLDGLAPMVDKVIGEQLSGLVDALAP